MKLAGTIIVFVAICLACGGSTSTPASDVAVAADTTPAWLTSARAAGATVDDDPCDFTNPTYEALRHVNVGVTQDPAVARHAVETDPELESIRLSDVGQRWLYAQDADIDSDTGIATMLRDHPDWTEVYAVIPRTLSFSQPSAVTVTQRMGGVVSHTGTWTVKNGVVHIEMPTESWALIPQRGAFSMALSNDDDTWAMNPVVCL